MEKGIIIIATGHPYYGRLAYNLAVTIKAAEPDMHITCVHRPPGLNHLNNEQREIFDQFVLLGDNYGRGFQTKLFLDELTPYEKTLYLDSDMLWLPSMRPSELIDSLNGVSFTAITEGSSDDINRGYYFWATPNEIKSVYHVEKVYQWRSEIIYFEKGTQVFARARTLNPANDLQSVKKFGDQIPDELYFNIATALCDVHPHQYKWQPAYWPRMHGDFVKPTLNGFYLVSFGSNYASPQMRTLYDRIMRNAATKTGMQSQFALHSKRSFIEERKKM